MNISEDIRKILLSLGLSRSLCPNHRSLRKGAEISASNSPHPLHSTPGYIHIHTGSPCQCHGGECCHDIQAGLWPEEDHSEPSHTAKLGQDPTWRLAHCILLQALTYLQWFSLDAPTGPPVSGDPTPRCRSTLVPFRVGAGPPGPDPATKCRVPRDHPPCRGSCSAAHPMGSLPLGKALACARERGTLLSCNIAASES